MFTKRAILAWTASGGGAVLLAVLLAIELPKRAQVKVLTGVVLRADPDPQKQTPVVNAKVTARGGVSAGAVQSDESGFFRMKLRPGIWRHETISLYVEHPDFKPLSLTETAGDQLSVARLVPMERESPKEDVSPVTVTNVRIRYEASTVSVVNVGTSLKTFEVSNVGNIPCNGQPPCSPDGRWKATIGGTSLDASEGNSFSDARVSCIAGPCPFTKIETDAFSKGGRVVRVSVRNWSDTATFLFEGEVTRIMPSREIRQSYPVVFGQAMDFTLPGSAEGPSIEAELNNADIVFPLGPEPDISWLTCIHKTASDSSELFRCEMKAGYRFGNH